MKYMLLMLTLLVSGCASVSDKDSSHVVTFDEQDFVGISPNSIRARLVVDDFVKLRTITLGAEIESAEGKVRKEFPLALVGMDMMQAERSWIFVTQSRNRYDFQLTEAGQQQFAEFQKWLASQACSQYRYAFDVSFADDINRSFSYSLKLQLSPSKGFITMVDNRHVHSPFES
ncbi:hypothetical protein [Shewanella sp.]|uniref:hypothetical protein n=1 Tax=Shewanella sp. TaxID=50422 RepID=UPI003A974731